MGVAIPNAEHHDALELRALARREKNGRVTSRIVAIANALDGMTRLAAARSAGMDRQTLRDWVIRYNADADRQVGETRPKRPRGWPDSCGGEVVSEVHPNVEGIISGVSITGSG